jgi:Tol biopolymer transport system component
MECLLTELLAFLRDGEVSNYSTDSYRLNRDKSVAVSNTAKMSKDLSTCPRGVKVLLLGSGGVLVIGQYSGESFWESWCPLPSRAD